MDVFDLTDYAELVPRRVRKVVALVALVALASLPPVREWYVNQAMVHGKHVADEIISHIHLVPTAPSPSTPPAQPAPAKR